MNRPVGDGLERHTLRSVGIDIGSVTSHVVISDLSVRRLGSAWSTRLAVAERRTRYAGRPLPTPYLTEKQLDAGGIGEFIAAAYAEAGVAPDEIDTGVVVVTGDALRKANAEHVAGLFGQLSGRFVGVSAGAHHEAVLAAHGSGSVELSARTGATVLNLDVGGAATKVALVVGGTVEHTEAFAVGAQATALDGRGRVVRVGERAHALADEVGVLLQLGATVRPDDLDALAGVMADTVLDAIAPNGRAALRRRLLVTRPGQSPQYRIRLDRIVFSGGVSEYVYGRADGGHADLGPRLGAAIVERLRVNGLAPLITPAAQGLRATAVGASQFSVQAGGQTSFVSDAALLPAWGLHVVPVRMSRDVDPHVSVRTALRGVGLERATGGVALAVSFDRVPDYSDLRRCAEALADLTDAGRPLHVVLRADLARSLGRILSGELGHRGGLVVIDGVDLDGHDHVDLGPALAGTTAVPVIAKSLAFPPLA